MSLTTLRIITHKKLMESVAFIQQLRLLSKVDIHSMKVMVLNSNISLSVSKTKIPLVLWPREISESKPPPHILYHYPTAMGSCSSIYSVPKNAFHLSSYRLTSCIYSVFSSTLFTVDPHTSFIRKSNEKQLGGNTIPEYVIYNFQTLHFQFTIQRSQ